MSSGDETIGSSGSIQISVAVPVGGGTGGVGGEGRSGGVIGSSGAAGNG